MTTDVFRGILDDVSEKPRLLHLNLMGEPLLNQEISEFVVLSKKAGHHVTLTTNGTLMNERISRNLLMAGVDHVTFSIDGIEARTYETIRIGAYVVS